MSCTSGCIINSQVGGDHAYCSCHCHFGSFPAIPPSRERRKENEVKTKLEYLGDKLVEYSSAEYEMYNEKGMRDEILRLRASNASLLEVNSKLLEAVQAMMATRRNADSEAGLYAEEIAIQAIASAKG